MRESNNEEEIRGMKERADLEGLVTAMRSDGRDVVKEARRRSSSSATKPRLLELMRTSSRWSAGSNAGGRQPHDPEAGDALIAALDDPDRFVRELAARPGRDRRRAACSGSSRLPETRAQRRRAPSAPSARSARAGRTALLVKIKDGDPRIRERRKALGLIGEPEALEALTAAAADADPYVREGVARALGRIGDRRAIEPLLALLGDRDSYVREYAARALGALGNGRAVDPLTRAVHDPDGEVREEAVRSLRLLGVAARSRTTRATSGASLISPSLAAAPSEVFEGSTGRAERSAEL
jgi:HEAT repeat protein